MPSYEASEFDPPAPVTRVVLRNPKTGATVAGELLLATDSLAAPRSRAVRRPATWRARSRETVR